MSGLLANCTLNSSNELQFTILIRTALFAGTWAPSAHEERVDERLWVALARGGDLEPALRERAARVERGPRSDRVRRCHNHGAPFIIHGRRRDEKLAPPRRSQSVALRCACREATQHRNGVALTANHEIHSTRTARGAVAGPSSVY